MLPLLLSLLTALPASAAAPELVCEPDSVVRYEHHWFGTSEVRLLREGLELSVPWTGKETVTTGRSLRAAVDGTPDRAPAELLYLPDFAEFLTYRAPATSDGTQVALHVEKSLLRSSEQDGLVVVQRSRTEPGKSTASDSRLSLLHCRRR